MTNNTQEVKINGLIIEYVDDRRFLLGTLGSVNSVTGNINKSEGGQEILCISTGC